MIGILTIDIGTTSLRAILYDELGRPGGPDQRANPPRHYADGRVEQDPETWRSLVPQLLRGAAEEAERRGLRIEAIALASQRSSLIPVDAAGEPLHPAIMWQDTRTSGIATELAPHLGLVRARTGSSISPVMSALKMLWLRRERPELYERSRKLVGIHDFVLHLLTGRYVTDPSLACRSNLLNLETLSWDPELLSLFQVEAEKLCELVPPGSVVGPLRAELARAAGLRTGLPVVSAGGDQQCAALGLGLLAPGSAASNTGTGSYLVGLSRRPRVDPAGRVTCSVAATPGDYIVEAALPASGSVLRWFADNFWTGDRPAEDPFAAIVREAEESGPGARGVLVLPHFTGSGSPGWNPRDRGLFAGVGLGTSRGDLARALFEGIAFALADGLELIEESCGPVDAVAVAGGMSRAELFNRIEADAFGRTVLRREGGGEATALGAFISGAAAIGLAPDHETAFRRAAEALRVDRYEPDRENHRRYRELRARSRRLREAAADIEALAAKPAGGEES